MTKQDKELLLKDLCARLRYKVKVQVNKVSEWDGETKRFVVSKELTFDDVKSLTENGVVSDIKPYLRPMSSMTEEERKVYNNMQCVYGATSISKHGEMTDWLNAHHFDYRGLVPKGLAIAVTEENNPYEN